MTGERKATLLAKNVAEELESHSAGKVLKATLRAKPRVGA